MAVLGKLLTELLLSAGVNIQADDLKDKLAPILVLGEEVPDNIAATLKTNLMTEESAKNNPTLKAHFKAQALNAMDATINDYIGSYEGFTDEDKAAFKNETSTYKRTELVLNKVKEIEGKKGSGSGDETEKLKALKKEIETLNGQVVTSKQEAAQAAEKIKAEAEARVREFAYRASLVGKKYANKDIDPAVNVMVARNLVDAQLNKDGAVAVMSETGEFKLVRKDDPEMDFMFENKKVEFGSYVDNVLSKNKIIEVSEDGQNGGQNGGKKTIETGGDGKQVGMQEGIDLIQQQIDAVAPR